MILVFESHRPGNLSDGILSGGQKAASLPNPVVHDVPMQRLTGSGFHQRIEIVRMIVQLFRNGIVIQPLGVVGVDKIQQMVGPLTALGADRSSLEYSVKHQRQ